MVTLPSSLSLTQKSELRFQRCDFRIATQYGQRGTMVALGLFLSPLTLSNSSSLAVQNCSMSINDVTLVDVVGIGAFSSNITIVGNSSATFDGLAMNSTGASQCYNVVLSSCPSITISGNSTVAFTNSQMFAASLSGGASNFGLGNPVVVALHQNSTLELDSLALVVTTDRTTSVTSIAANIVFGSGSALLTQMLLRTGSSVRLSSIAASAVANGPALTLSNVAAAFTLDLSGGSLVSLTNATLTVTANGNVITASNMLLSSPVITASGSSGFALDNVTAVANAAQPVATTTVGQLTSNLLMQRATVNLVGGSSVALLHLALSVATQFGQMVGNLGLQLSTITIQDGSTVTIRGGTMASLGSTSGCALNVNLLSTYVYVIGPRSSLIWRDQQLMLSGKTTTCDTYCASLLSSAVYVSGGGYAGLTNLSVSASGAADVYNLALLASQLVVTDSLSTIYVGHSQFAITALGAAYNFYVGFTSTITISKNAAIVVENNTLRGAGLDTVSNALVEDSSLTVDSGGSVIFQSNTASASGSSTVRNIHFSSIVVQISNGATLRTVAFDAQVSNTVSSDGVTNTYVFDTTVSLSNNATMLLESATVLAQSAGSGAALNWDIEQCTVTITGSSSLIVRRASFRASGSLGTNAFIVRVVVQLRGGSSMLFDRASFVANTTTSTASNVQMRTCSFLVDSASRDQVFDSTFSSFTLSGNSVNVLLMDTTISVTALSIVSVAGVVMTLAASSIPGSGFINNVRLSGGTIRLDSAAAMTWNSSILSASASGKLAGGTVVNVYWIQGTAVLSYSSKVTLDNVTLDARGNNVSTNLHCSSGQLSLSNVTVSVHRMSCTAFTSVGTATNVQVSNESVQFANSTSIRVTNSLFFASGTERQATAALNVLLLQASLNVLLQSSILWNNNAFVATCVNGLTGNFLLDNFCIARYSGNSSSQTIASTMTSTSGTGTLVTPRVSNFTVVNVAAINNVTWLVTDGSIVSIEYSVLAVHVGNRDNETYASHVANILFGTSSSVISLAGDSILLLASNEFRFESTGNVGIRDGCGIVEIFYAAVFVSTRSVLRVQASRYFVTNASLALVSLVQGANLSAAAASVIDLDSVTLTSLTTRNALRFFAHLHSLSIPTIVQLQSESTLRVRASRCTAEHIGLWSVASDGRVRVSTGSAIEFSNLTLEQVASKVSEALVHIRGTLTLADNRSSFTLSTISVTNSQGLYEPLVAVESGANWSQCGDCTLALGCDIRYDHWTVSRRQVPSQLLGLNVQYIAAITAAMGDNCRGATWSASASLSGNTPVTSRSITVSASRSETLSAGPETMSKSVLRNTATGSIRLTTSPTASSTVELLPPPQRRQKDISGTAFIGAVAILSALVSSPTMGMAVRRLTLLIALGDCGNLPDPLEVLSDTMDVTNAPLQLSIPPKDGATQRGAVVGNLLWSWAVLPVAAAVVAVTRTAHHRCGVRRSLSSPGAVTVVLASPASTVSNSVVALKLPGLVLTLGALMQQQLATSSVLLLVQGNLLLMRGSYTSAIVTGVAGLLLGSGAFLGLMLVLLDPREQRFAAAAKTNRNGLYKDARQRSPTGYLFLWQRLTRKSHRWVASNLRRSASSPATAPLSVRLLPQWCATGAPFVACFGALFDSAREGFHWWLLVDLAVTLALGAAVGVVPTSRVTCLVQAGFCAAISGVLLLVQCVYRPLVSISANTTLIVVYGGQFLVALLSAVGVDDSVTAGIAWAATVVVLLQSVADVAELLLAALRARKWDSNRGLDAPARAHALPELSSQEALEQVVRAICASRCIPLCD